MKDISVLIDGVKFNFRVGLLIRSRGRVLLERGDGFDFSTIPGGRVKTLETTKGALIREILEELEFDISKQDVTLLSIIENFFEVDGMKFHELYYVYKIELDDSSELANSDNLINKDSGKSVYTWVNMDELANIKILPIELKDLIKSNEFKTIVASELD